MPALVGISPCSSRKGLNKHGSLHFRFQLSQSSRGGCSALVECFTNWHRSPAFARGLGFSFALNRATSAHIACAPHRRITKQGDKNGRWIKPTCLTEPPNSLCSNGGNSASHARDRARGFRLVKVCQETQKLRTPSERRKFQEQAENSLGGFLPATDSNRSRNFLSTLTSL